MLLPSEHQGRLKRDGTKRQHTAQNGKKTHGRLAGVGTDAHVRRPTRSYAAWVTYRGTHCRLQRLSLVCARREERQAELIALTGAEERNKGNNPHYRGQRSGSRRRCNETTLLEVVKDGASEYSMATSRMTRSSYSNRSVSAQKRGVSKDAPLRSNGKSHTLAAVGRNPVGIRRDSPLAGRLIISTA